MIELGAAELTAPDDIPGVGRIDFDGERPFGARFAMIKGIAPAK
ncbi:hypothetical protein ACIBSV_29835 [Embleya sp. NPDC050154]